MFSARLIPLEAVYPLRLMVLRPGGTLADCHFESDRVDGGFHVGTFLHDACIAVGSFSPEAHPDLPAQRPYRLRGMATHPEHQGTGAGKALMVDAFAEIERRGGDQLWCNARLIAVPFYQRLGLHTYGEPFEIAKYGVHYVMLRSFTVEG
jgi:GNAT superfamily N-acetyltransferase